MAFPFNTCCAVAGRSPTGLAGTSIKSCVKLFLDRKPCQASIGTHRSGGSHWAHGQYPWIGARLESDGKTLLSYRQPIARWKNGTLEIECRQFSISTSNHQDAVGWGARKQKIPTVCHRFEASRTYYDDSLYEFGEPEGDPIHPSEAWRIRRFSLTRKGETRKEAERRAVKAEELARKNVVEVKRRRREEKREEAIRDRARKRRKFRIGS